MTPVLVVSGHVLALGVIRAFGSVGCPVDVASFSERDIGRKSRHVRHVLTIPDPAADEPAFIDALIAWGRSSSTKPLLVPVEDAPLAAAARHDTRLAEVFINAFPSREIVERIIDKRYTYAVAREVGVSAPETITVRSPEEAAAAARSIGFPCLVKPAESHGYFARFNAKYRLVSSPDEATAACAEALAAGFDVMVQEFIDGEDDHGVNYNAYAIDGEVKVEFTARKVRMAPRGGGVPSVVRSEVVPGVTELGRRMLQALRFTGFACSEFKWDARTGRFRFFEINGRYNRSNRLATRCGINFPALDYAYRVEGRLPAPAAFQPGVYWIDEFKDLQHLPERVRQRPSNIFRFWRPYFGPCVFAIHDWHDCRPIAHRLKQGAVWAARKLLGPRARKHARGTDVAPSLPR